MTFTQRTDLAFHQKQSGKCRMNMTVSASGTIYWIQILLCSRSRRIIMKKMTMTALAAVLLAGCATADKPAETAAASADSFTSASVSDFYGDSGLSGDTLWAAFDSFQLTPSVATVNPDGTPNIAVVIPGSHTEADGNDYFVFGLADNQTKANLEEKKEGVMTLVGGFDSDKKALSGIGARVSFTVVTDEDEAAAVRNENEKITDENIICRVTEIRPLG